MNARIPLIVAIMTGCGDDIRPVDIQPDCSVGLPDAHVDAGIDSPMVDAEVCWMYKNYTCGNEIYQICVPYAGCSTFECNGLTLGYCGPGILDAGV